MRVPRVGNPFTLEQAQSHLLAGPLGGRITFVRADPVEYLASSDKVFDVAVLAHCIWYFASPSTLLRTFKALAPHTKKICIAEWSLTASDSRGIAHVLAALTQAAFECRKPDSESNIRTVLSPRRITELATDAGFKLEAEWVIPSPTMLDGMWEVGPVVSANYLADVRKYVENEREIGVIEAMQDATRSAKAALPAEAKPGAMDTWIGVFVIDT